MTAVLFLCLAIAGCLIIFVGLTNPDTTGMHGAFDWKMKLISHLGGRDAEHLYSEIVRWTWVGIGVVMVIGGLIAAAYHAFNKG